MERAISLKKATMLSSELPLKNESIKSFAYYDNGNILYSKDSIVHTSEKLVPGFYDVSYDSYNDKYLINRSNEIPIKQLSFDDQEKFEKYLNVLISKESQARLKKLNILNKGGVLFYGKEGTGKSTVCRYYANQCIEKHNSVVIYLDSEDFGICWNFVKTLIQIHSDTFFIIILEEIDNYLKHPTGEEIIKKVLDGNLSVNNFLLLATTNYIEEIPDTLINRPSRFKYAIEIGLINNEETVKNIINNLLQDTEYDKEQVLKACKGKSLDYIQQYCLNIIFDLDHSENSLKTKISL
jgi:Cdc6-like AAA superfamily ATPase